METINIYLIADCASLLANETQGTAANPTLIRQSKSNPYLWLFASESFSTNQIAKPELCISGHPWQTMIWSAGCLASGTQYNVILQDIEPLQKGVVTPPVAVEIDLELYSGAPGTDPQLQPFQQFVFISTVLNARSGSGQYDITFSIVDVHGDVLGYFSWSPCIDIKQGRLIPK